MAASGARGSRLHSNNDCRPQPLRFASYNVLAQSLLQQNMQLYRKCHPKALDPVERSYSLLQHIVKLRADVLALQEVEKFEEARTSLACVAATSSKHKLHCKA